MLDLAERLTFAGEEFHVEGFSWYQEANALAGQLAAKDKESKIEDPGVFRWNVQAVEQQQTQPNADEVSPQSQGNATDDADNRRSFSGSLTTQREELLPSSNALDVPTLKTDSRSQPLFSQSQLEAFTQGMPSSASENSKAGPFNISLNVTSITKDLPDEAGSRKSNEPRSETNVSETNDKVALDDKQKHENCSSPLRLQSGQHTTGLAPSAGSPPRDPHKVNALSSAQPGQDSTLASVENTEAEKTTGQKGKQAVPPSFAHFGSSVDDSREPGPAPIILSGNNYVDPMVKYGTRLAVQDASLGVETNDPSPSLAQPGQDATAASSNPVPPINKLPARFKKDILAFKPCDKDFVALSWSELRQAAQNNMNLSPTEAKSRRKASLTAQAVKYPDDAMYEELIEDPTHDLEVQYNDDLRAKKRVAQKIWVEQGQIDEEDCEDFGDSDNED